MNKVCSLLFVISSVLLSCSTDVGNFQIGEDLVKSKSSITITDTFAVKLSTILLDSIPTSDADQILAGKYSTGVTGPLEMCSYFNFDRSETVSTLDEEAVFDSLTIELGYSGYYLGDTTQLQKLSLYRLTEQLELLEDASYQKYLYNNSSFSHEPQPLAEVSFIPFPTGKDSIEFRLPDELGLELMDLVYDKENAMEDNERFNEYLKGFVLKSAADSKAIIGFTGDTAGIKLNLYTHLVELEKMEKRYTYYLAAENTHFNQAIADRSATPFSVLQNQREELPSTGSDNRTYVQGSAGIVTRIDFPSLNNIFLLEDQVMIKAELILFPATENEFKFIPKALQFYASDRINRLGENLTMTSSNRTVSVEASLRNERNAMDEWGRPVEPRDLSEALYIADISQHLLTQLAGNYYDPDNGLIVSIPLADLQKKADVLILNGEKTPLYKPKLKLYFLKHE